MSFDLRSAVRESTKPIGSPLESDLARAELWALPEWALTRFIADMRAIRDDEDEPGTLKVLAARYLDALEAAERDEVPTAAMLQAIATAVAAVEWENSL